MADWKFLDWRNRQDSSLNQPDLPGDDCTDESSPVAFPDNDTPVEIVFKASLSQVMEMLSALEKGAQLSYPDTWHSVWWNFVKNWECPVPITIDCEALQACLAPWLEKIDVMSERIEEIEQTLDNLEDFTEQNINSNVAKPLQDITNTNCLAIYPGAAALVEQMNKNNQKYYTEAEASFVDNASEALSIVLELYPSFAGQTYDEGFELGNAYFENQVTAYNADYEEFAPVATCDLMSRIALNYGKLTIDVWGDWLFNLPTLIPSNAAAAVFTRYSPLRQTFLNQIAALLNSENSLQFYFDELWQVYNAGTEAPIAELPVGCDCPEITCEDYDFRISDWSPIWQIRDNVTAENMSQYASGVGYEPREQSVGGFQNQIYTLSGIGCSTLEYVYVAVNAPTQVQLFWCDDDVTTLEYAADMDVGSGTVTGYIDISALTRPSWGTGYLLVSGDDFDIDNVVTWQQANFS